MHFSVIIPAKNEETSIARCLNSLLNVDWERNDYEIIVVDNGSDDRTVSIASEKGASVFIKPGLTISALRNFGARQANGEILVFLDADCTVTKEWLREALRYIFRGDVVCFGSPPIVPENATWVQEAWFQVRRKRVPTGEVDWLESMNMFVRRREFFSAGGFNEDLVTCEDYDLSFRLKSVGKLIADERIRVVHHGEAASVGHFFRKEYWRGTGNLSGVFHHGISMKELPSVAFPIIHAALAVCVIFSLIAGILSMNDLILLVGVSLIFAWQVPLFFMAVWKNRYSFHFFRTLQLYLLLNIYFLARGGAILQRR